MLRCELCTTSERLRLTPASESESQPAGMIASVVHPVCASCGRPLAGGAGERLIAKLGQLARFGLAGAPLLAAKRRS